MGTRRTLTIEALDSITALAGVFCLLLAELAHPGQCWA